MSHEHFHDLAALDAVGALEEQEILELHRHLDECTECQTVEREFGEAASALALALAPVAPPSRVRAAVMRSAPQEDELDEPVTLASRRRPWWLAAAAIFFLALFGWSELRVRALREEISVLAAARNLAVEESRRLAEANGRLTSQVSELSSPSNRTVTLVAQNVAPTAKAKLFMSERHHSAIIFFENLPQTPSDKQYQLWIIRANQPAPQPAGTFNVEPTGAARVVMRDMPEESVIKAVAVTLEPRGGMPSPTGEKYLVGVL